MKAKVNKRPGILVLFGYFGLLEYVYPLVSFLIFTLTQKDTLLYLFSSFIFFLKAFCHAFVVENFVNTVSEKHLDEKTREVLTSSCRLYGVHGIITNLGEFIQVVSCAFVYFYLRSRSEDE